MTEEDYDIGDAVDTAEMLFEIRRHQILAAALNPQTKEAVTDAFAYAWNYKIYPHIADSNGLAKPFLQYFSISKSKVLEFMDRVENLDDTGHDPSIYRFEQEFRRHHWTKDQVLTMLVYIRLLEDHFEEFWKRFKTADPAGFDQVERHAKQSRSEYIYLC